MGLDKLTDLGRSPDPERVLFDDLRKFVHRPISCCKAGSSRSDHGDISVLLVGHIGAGNVGSEMRTAEVLRHVAFLFGSVHVRFTGLLNGPFQPGISNGQATFATLDGYLPERVVDLADQHDVVIACEGSMLKSSFSNVLAGIMAGALARASVAEKLAIGYGAEIGAMEPVLQSFVEETLGGALFLCRNEASFDRARALGLRAEPGADTGWIHKPASELQARAVLQDLGLSAPILIVCPTNPFWWPVRLNPAMADAAQHQASLQELRFADTFFHTYDARRKAAFERYIDALATASSQICRDRGLSLLLLAMDPTDIRACQALQQRLGMSVPIMLGHQYRPGLVMGVLRTADFLISSRFHALVAAIPAAVPFAGVATDERIVNLLEEGKCNHLLTSADAPDLADRLIRIARQVDPQVVQEVATRLVRREVCALGRMGMAFVAEVRRRMPEIPLPDRPARWDAFLPKLPSLIEDLLTV